MLENEVTTQSASDIDADDPVYKLKHQRAASRSLALSGILMYAEHVLRDAGNIMHNINRLEELPKYDTQAEAAVETAEAALSEALQRIQYAKAKFKSLIR